MNHEELIELERDRLLKRLSIDLFHEAMSESPDAKIMELIDLKKSGDHLLLGLAVSELIDDYAEAVVKYRYGYTKPEATR